jgi:transposase
VVDQVGRGVGGVVVEVRAAAGSVACPNCGIASARMHGRYQRSLADTPRGGAPVVIRVLVRRFACREA